VVARVTRVLEQIDSAAREQSIGVGQVGESVQHLDSITQQNAAMVEQLAAAASTLNSQVGQVHNAIRVFRLTDKDKSLAEMDAVELRKQSRDEAPPPPAVPARSPAKAKAKPPAAAPRKPVAPRPVIAPPPPAQAGNAHDDDWQSF